MTKPESQSAEPTRHVLPTLISLEGRVAIVTGGSSGIGRQTCLLFAELGARVCVVDLAGDSPAGDESTIAAIESTGSRASFHACDVRDGTQVRDVVARIDAEHGGIDVLVNSAGVRIGRETDALETSDADWERVIGVNLTGSFYMARETIRSMVNRERPGKVVNVASISGIFGSRKATAYGTSKGGVVSLTRHLAVDWASHQINVNAIAPGSTSTPMLADEAPAVGAAIDALIPLGRRAAPQEIAGAAAYLSSSMADYITGHVLVVDGGTTAGNWRPADT